MEFSVKINYAVSHSFTLVMAITIKAIEKMENCTEIALNIFKKRIVGQTFGIRKAFFRKL